MYSRGLGFHPRPSPFRFRAARHSHLSAMSVLHSQAPLLIKYSRNIRCVSNVTAKYFRPGVSLFTLRRLFLTGDGAKDPWLWV
jgi:hypothetical protein